MLFSAHLHLSLPLQTPKQHCEGEPQVLPDERHPPTGAEVTGLKVGSGTGAGVKGEGPTGAGVVGGNSVLARHLRDEGFPPEQEPEQQSAPLEQLSPTLARVHSTGAAVTGDVVGAEDDGDPVGTAVGPGVVTGGFVGVAVATGGGVTIGGFVGVAVATGGVGAGPPAQGPFWQQEPQ